MIRKIGDYFILETKNTSYCFRVLKSGHLEHLYYGKKINISSKEDCARKFKSYYHETGNTIFYNESTLKQSLEDTPLEFGSYGKGDIGEPLVEVTFEDGSFTTDFLYENYAITGDKKALESLPSSYNCSQQLTISLKEKHKYIVLQLNYALFYDCDVIVRSSKIINKSSENIKLDRLLSNSVDFAKPYTVISFHGNWANEMNMHKTDLSCGKLVLSSYTGTSSSRCNPFFMLADKSTDQNNGECYGFNLIYSGNHYSAIEARELGKTRVVCGISPVNFCFEIQSGEGFEACESVMTYSDKGFNELSNHMHSFINNHIIRGKYKNKIRPVLVNSWEGCYFDINENKLVNLAQMAAKAGMELMVMDDGWFGRRNDDLSSLGDWFYNEDKLPNGLSGLCEKVRRTGVDFGLWVEPEMISVDSKLYGLHPEWAMCHPAREHSEGRNQRILDIINPDVQQYVIEAMSNIFSCCRISYVKWDMNRIFSDVYSPYLKDKQKETNHRYVMSLYRIMGELVKRFPDILFEGCSGGGNRFDLGILCYFPQIWASDNTDANCRLRMQESYSYGYPVSSYTCHVSICPNHQTGKSVSWEKRFYTACFGNLGYELNLTSLSEEEFKKICEQVTLYKKYREVFMFGDFTRKEDENYYRWQVKKGNTTIQLKANKDENNDESLLMIFE